MNAENKIKKLIDESKITTDTQTEKRILGDAFKHLDKLKQQKSPSSRPYMWRNIMKNPITKFAAAAIIIIAAAISLFTNNNLIPTAYALEDTIEAYNSVRSLHVKAFWTVAGEKCNLESWVEFDEDGKLARFRHQFSWITTEKHIGPATFVYDGDKSRTWFPNQNLCFRKSGKSALTGALLQYTRTNADPKLVIEKLYQQAERGEIILEINEPDQKNEPIVLVVTYPGGTRSANWKKVLYIDQATRLVKKEETFEMRGGQYQHERTAEFFDYNQQIDQEIFNLEPELPENVFWINLLDKEVGLARGNMTDEEIAKEITSQVLQAGIAKDFDKVGQLFFGVPGFFIQKLLGINGIKKIISIGPVHRDPDPDSNLIICSCNIVFEAGGQYYEGDAKVYVVPVSYQPGRWMICRTIASSRPAADGIIQEE